jgi:hypothetical protein
MPTIGEQSTHRCPDCDQPMDWTEAALRNPDLLAGSPLCGSYETAAWSNGEDAPHYHVICGACGNDSIIEP